MGAFIFTHLEVWTNSDNLFFNVSHYQGDNEIQTRIKVGNNRREVLDELYNITGQNIGFKEAPKYNECQRSYCIITWNLLFTVMVIWGFYIFSGCQKITLLQELIKLLSNLHIQKWMFWKLIPRRVYQIYFCPPRTGQGVFLRCWMAQWPIRDTNCSRLGLICFCLPRHEISFM